MGRFYDAGIGESLIPWVRQLAWLHAVPKRERKVVDREEPLSRLEQMKRADMVVAMPDNPLPYLTDWLFEIGPTVPAGMGSGIITWRDLSSWQDVTGVRLKAWEGRLLRRLSAVYLDQSRKAEKPDCPSPWTDLVAVASNRDRVASGVRSMFRGLATQGKPR